VDITGILTHKVTCIYPDKVLDYELRVYLGMNNPNSIYKWFRGEVLPTLENMYALSVILEVPIDDIIGRTA